MSKTIRRLSEDLHITKQAIYQRMDAIEGFRDKYTTKIGNRIMVSEAGERLIIKFDNIDKYSHQDNQEKQQQDTEDHPNHEIKLLMHQLDVKDQQLEAKDKQLERLQKSLDQQQQLQLATITENKTLKQQIEHLDGVRDASNSTEDHGTKHHAWWKFWG